MSIEDKYFIKNKARSLNIKNSIKFIKNKKISLGKSKLSQLSLKNYYKKNAIILGDGSRSSSLAGQGLINFKRY